jgi:acetyl-CoA synthetase
MATMPQTKGDIADLLHEERQFEADPAFKAQANCRDPKVYETAAADPEAFWAGWAKQLFWEQPWDKVLDWKPPHAKWFVGGRTNICYNCVDRHVAGPRRNKAALIWEGENYESRTMTYWDLYRDVNKAANVLKKLGVGKGDRVAIYLPMVPEAVVAMLACARIGAVHSVVFGGFSPESLADRINDAQAKLLITADGGFRRGNLMPLKHDADFALQNCPSVKNVLIVKRGEFPLRIKEGRDHWWHRMMDDVPARCEPEWVDSEDMLYILYTSGTTGKPKGIVHTTGGYMVQTYATSQWVFDLKEEDVFWCTADIGWVTGHSYLTYGPLANGATCVMYEGAPNWPDNDRFWRIVEKYGVTIFYTAPTAIRAFMKWGRKWPAACDLTSLRLLGTVGEPINPEAWMWYHEHIGGKRCPIVDTWWQTETGAIMITPLPGVTPMKPGSAMRAFPGVASEILNEKGEKIPVGGGLLAITQPWPAMLRGIYGDMERYVQTYWSKWDGKPIYFPGDGAKRDADGNFTIIGRVDDVINIAGHRIGTMEIESALVDHPMVAESACVGRAHEIKGSALVAFVTIKESAKEKAAAAGTELLAQLKDHVANKIGAIARPDEIILTADLPKTRSGKIMRRLLKDVAEGRMLGDVTTLADPNVIAMLQRQYNEE